MLLIFYILCSLWLYNRIENDKAVELGVQITEKHEKKHDDDVTLDKQGFDQQCEGYKEC